jgi:acyl-CoA thioesterase YciA
MTRSGPPERAPELRTIAMPADTNAAGDIFGGWLLAQMDLAGGSYEDLKVTEGVFTFVALNEDGSKRPVPSQPPA